MNYEIHLYAPKTGKLTPSMVEWLFQHGQSTDQPELFWPVRKINTLGLSRVLIAFDRTLVPVKGEGKDVELLYPMTELGIKMYVHERGVIITFPFMGSMLAQIVLRIIYTYIRFLFDKAGFWSYDPQLNVLSYADDFRSIDETAELMEAWLPKLLE